MNQESKTTSFLSESIELKGNLYLKGGVRIDGKVSGKIDSEATIFIGENARVKADLVAPAVISSGSIMGDIVASKVVKINYPGTLEGEVTTCSLGVEKGVYFSGKCHILSPPNNPRPKTMLPKPPSKAIAHRE